MLKTKFWKRITVIKLIILTILGRYFKFVRSNLGRFLTMMRNNNKSNHNDIFIHSSNQITSQMPHHTNKYMRLKTGNEYKRSSVNLFHLPFSNWDMTYYSQCLIFWFISIYFTSRQGCSRYTTASEWLIMK